MFSSTELLILKANNLFVSAVNLCHEKSWRIFVMKHIQLSLAFGISVDDWRRPLGAFPLQELLRIQALGFPGSAASLCRSLSVNSDPREAAP